MEQMDQKIHNGIHNDMEDRQAIVRIRTNMTIFHFVSTVPKWSLSLFLFLSSLSVPLLSPSEAIQKPLRRVQFLVDNESNSYLQCTQRASKRLLNQLDEVAKMEYERVIDSHMLNKEIIAKAQTATDACVNATKKARACLVTLNNSAMPITWLTGGPSCSALNRSDVIEFVGEDFQLVENEVSNIFQSYIQSSRDSIEAINEFAEARATYDYNYFVAGRIQPILAVLKNADFPDPFVAVLLQQEFDAKFESILVPIGLEFDKAIIQINLLLKRVKEFAVSIDSFYDAYADIYSRMEQAAEFIQDIIPLETQVPAIFDLNTVPLGDALLPPTFQVPTFRDPLLTAKEILETTTKRVLEIVNQIIMDLEDQATDHARATLAALTNQLHGILTFEEYNPPKFVGSRDDIGNAFDEIELLIERAETAQEATRRALDKLQGLETLDTNDIDSGSTLDAGNYAFSEEQTSFQYLRPLSPSISIPDVLEAFIEWVYVNTWILEVVVQAVRLWKIEAAYSKGAVPDLPKIEYSIDGEKEKNPKSSMSLLVLSILRTIVTPWMILLIIFFPVAIGAVTFWYPHVQLSCIHSTNGTFFANNILSPLLINEASALGNGFYVKAEHQCQRTQNDLCKMMRDELDNLHRMDEMNFRHIKSQHKQSSRMLGLVDTCVDSNIDNLINEACCGLKGYHLSECQEESTKHICPIDVTASPPAAFRPIKEYVLEPGCQATIQEWELQNSRYDCGRFSEICGQISCDGVNESLIRSQTIKSDCQVETYVIRCCLFALVTLYHAIVINIICTLVFKGTRQVLWRRLCPDGIKLLTHMNEDGSIVKGDNQSDRSKRVAVAIRRFEMLGKLQLGCGIVVLLGWFTSIFLIRA